MHVEHVSGNPRHNIVVVLFPKENHEYSAGFPFPVLFVLSRRRRAQDFCAQTARFVRSKRNKQAKHVIDYLTVNPLWRMYAVSLYLYRASVTEFRLRIYWFL